MANFDIAERGQISADGALAAAVMVDAVSNQLALLIAGTFTASVQARISFDGVQFVDYGTALTAPGYLALPACHKVQLVTASYSGVDAEGTLTGSANFADGETVTIGTKVYTFEDELTDVDGNVHVGSDLEESCDFLRAAINLDAGAGTAYAASMTEHPDVSATDTATTVVATAKVEGSAANAIATTETGANAAWGAVTLEGGLGPVEYQLGGLRDV